MNRSGSKVAPEPIQLQKAVSQPNDINRSEMSIISTVTKKARLSQTLKKSISVSINEQKGIRQHEKQPEQAETKLTQFVRTKIKQLKRVSICQICNARFSKSQISLCDCEHKDSFCQSCLYLYAIYKIKQFEEVYCPSDNCGTVLDTQNIFFKRLSVKMQNTYHKIHQFTIATKDPSIVKFCPNQKCEGFLRLKGNHGLFCSTCLKQYCTKCHLERHDGQCEEFQVTFFQNNLHFRQCSKCKMIVQRNKGCNHITCRCKYQFCYICGERWSSYHAKMHSAVNQNGQVVERVHRPSYIVEIMECCVCNQCRQGSFAIFWNSFAGIVLKFILKLFVLLVQILMLLGQMIFKDVPFLLWISICTLLIGLFFSSIQVICQSELHYGLLLMLFFPVAMLLGILRSWSEVFLPAIHQFYNGSILPIVDEFCDIIRF